MPHYTTHPIIQCTYKYLYYIDINVSTHYTTHPIIQCTCKCLYYMFLYINSLYNPSYYTCTYKTSLCIQTL